MSNTKKETILLELYKLYVQTTNNISERRHNTNKFYISILSALLGFPLVLNNNFLEKISIITLIISFLGILLCILWNINILSYRQLNTGKFKVIHELEEKLPFPLYKREWELLGKGKDSNKYLQLTRVERHIPFLLIIPYLILLFLSVHNLLFNT